VSIAKLSKVSKVQPLLSRCGLHNLIGL
jgi:hypothetical protein